jgi:possible membrane associated protein
MKKQILMTVMGAAIVLAACGNKKEDTTVVMESTKSMDEESSDMGNTVEETKVVLSKANIHLKYSNLVDTETRDRVSNALKNAGLSEEKIKSFFEAVDEYNNAVGSENLAQSVMSIEAAFPTYDQDKLVDAWLDNGGYVGRNCRITSYSLMGDFITVGNPTPGDTTMLFSDFASIESKKIFDGEDKAKFDTLYSYIDVTNTHDTNVLSDEIVKSLDDKQISFNNDKMHMISVFMTMDDGMNPVQEFIGHTGILVQDGDKYLFIEKLAFELPYQVEEFDNLQDVNDYLMGYYDNETDGITAKPIIFEDGKVMDEYRVLK